MRLATLRPWILLLPAWAAGAAIAQADPADALAWRCWYDQRVHISCVLQSAPEASEAVSLPRNVPGVVQDLRNRPGLFRNRFVHVPLISPPVDMRSVAFLARATMCGAHPACSVQFEPRPPAAAELLALQARFLEAGMDAFLWGESPHSASH